MKRREGVARRRGCIPLVLGLVLMTIGVPMLVCPGPGIATIAMGAAMVGAGLGLDRIGRR